MFNQISLTPCNLRYIYTLFSSDKKMIYTYSANNVETEMPLNLAAKVQRQSTQNGFFVYSSGGKPFILNEPSNTLLQFWWKLPVIHPLFCIFLFKSPLFNFSSWGLQIILFSKIEKDKIKKIVTNNLPTFFFFQNVRSTFSKIVFWIHFFIIDQNLMKL